MWGCFLMSGVKILHFLKDWWKSIPIHQNYTMALIMVFIGPCEHHYTMHFFFKLSLQNVKMSLTLKVPEKLQLYGLYVHYVVHICDFGMLRVNVCER